MRVLHLLDPAVLRPTDYRSRTLALIAALRAQGVQTVQLAAPCVSGTPGVAHGGVAAPHAHACHVYPTTVPARPPWLDRSPRLSATVDQAVSAAAFALRLRRIARLTRPDLLHVHAPNSHGPVWHALATFAGGCRRLPLVAEADRRGAQGHAVPPLERWALARHGALAAPSLEMRAAMRCAGVTCRRIAIIPPASTFAGVPRRDCLPPGLENAPLLAYAGALERHGGIDLLLAVLDGLRRHHPALRLVVAGGGLREDVLAERIGASPARGHVVVTGALSARRLADVLPRADIAVFPALPGPAEALAPPRPLLDAMAQGCCVVASDIACHRELVVHGHNALLFSAGSRHALLDVLLGLLERPERRRALGIAAAAFIAARHNWTTAASCYRRLYQAVLADAGR
jgi:glycogen(starch) synthase